MVLNPNLASEMPYAWISNNFHSEAVNWSGVYIPSVCVSTLAKFDFQMVWNEGHFIPKIFLHSVGENPFAFKRNQSKTYKNPFVPKILDSFRDEWRSLRSEIARWLQRTYGENDSLILSHKIIYHNWQTSKFYSASKNNGF